jgi:co-chaperonin GroES (HSP10)
MLKAIQNRIIVEPIEIQKSSVIYIENNEKPRKGKVVAVGPKVEELVVGDIVYFTSGWAYREVEFDGKKYLTCFEGDIFAKE